MTRRREVLNVQRKHVFLYTGDWEDLAAIFGPRRVQPGTAVRHIVHKVIERLKAQAEVNHRDVEINLDDVKPD